MWPAYLPQRDATMLYFAEWLKSDRGRATVLGLAEVNKLCLLDVVAAWLSDGDEILKVGLYEVFLVDLIVLIDAWHSGYPFDFDVLPAEETYEERGAARITEVISSLRGGDADEIGVGAPHELLNRNSFEAQRTLAEYRRARALTEFLEGGPRGKKTRK